jgi:FAD/FMN-containing dehydrogenase
LTSFLNMNYNERGIQCPDLARVRSSTWSHHRQGALVTILEHTTELDRSALRELARTFSGQLIQPRDPDYEQQRKIWNGSINIYPALIARCATAADVRSALRFATETGLQVAVRGGGHSFPGFSLAEGGIVIDLSLMRRIQVDPEVRTARAQGGVLLGELDAATQEYGLAVPSGIVTHTGVAGLTLGGGIGWLMRKYGLTIDQLLSADVVTADGELVTASATQNAELFWGIRGGGGNFGIVVDFEFRLNPVGPTVLAGPILWDIEDSPRVLRLYREWIRESPDELTTIVVHRRVPAVPVMPAELHGRHVVMVVGCYIGDLDAGERFIRPMRTFGTPLLDLWKPKPFVVHQAMFDASFPHGRWTYFRSCNIAEISDSVIDTVAANAARIASPFTAFPIFQLGGAVSRISDDDTAFTGRSAGHTVNITAATENADGFDEERQWVRDFWSELEPFHVSAYVNFLMDEGEARIRRAYGPEKYAQLRKLKRRYDPDNVFHLNQNIPPA